MMTLKEIKCPECNFPQSTFNLRLKVKDGFSSLACKNTKCRKVTVSSTWRCRCHKTWITCPMHVHEDQNTLRHVIIKRKQSEGEKHLLIRGIDERKPAKRGSNAEHALYAVQGEPMSGHLVRAMFKPDSVFARRPPHLMRREGTVTPPCQDGLPDQRG